MASLFRNKALKEADFLKTEAEKDALLQVELQSRISEEAGAHARQVAKLLGKSASTLQAHIAANKKVSQELMLFAADLRELESESSAAAPGSPSVSLLSSEEGGATSPPTGRKTRRAKKAQAKPVAPTIGQLIVGIENVAKLSQQLDELKETFASAQNNLAIALDLFERNEITEAKRIKRAFDKVLQEYSSKSKAVKLAEQRKNVAQDKMQGAQAELAAAQSAYQSVASDTRGQLERINEVAVVVALREFRQYVSVAETTSKSGKRSAARCLGRVPQAQMEMKPPAPDSVAAAADIGGGGGSPSVLTAAPSHSPSVPSKPIPAVPGSKPLPPPPQQHHTAPSLTVSATSSREDTIIEEEDDDDNNAGRGVVDDDDDDYLPSFSVPSSTPNSRPLTSSGFVPSGTSIKSQPVASSSSSSSSSQQQNSGDQKLAMIRELLPTQLEYLEALRAGVHHTMQTFRDDEALSSRVFLEDRPVLFGNLPELLVLAQQVYDDLNSCLLSWPELQPGAVFRKQNWRSVYQPYLSNYPRSVNLIDRCSKASRQFHAWATSPNSVTGKTLLELVGAPLGMVRTYEHFLENCNAASRSAEADHQALVTAYTEMTALAADALAAEEKAKNLRDLWLLSERLAGAKELDLLGDATRSYVLESSVDLLPTAAAAAAAAATSGGGGGGDDGEQIRLILLSDTLVEATQKRKLSGKKLTYRRKIPLHLARLLDGGSSSANNVFRIRIDDEQETTYTYSALSLAEKVEWTSKIAGVLSRLQRSRVFGIPLDVLMATRDKFNDIPFIVQHTVEEVIARGLRTEGIFRLSGSALYIRNMRKKIDMGEDVSFKADNPDCADIHVVAGLLKLWVRSLPDPLMTSAAHGDFLAVARTLGEPGHTPAAAIEQLKAIIGTLPKCNQYVVHHLVTFFELISGFAQDNKMNPHNIAIVFAPNLLGSSAGGMIDPSHHKHIFALVEFLIEHCDEIFKEVAAERRVIKESFHKMQQEKQEFEAQRELLLREAKLAI